MLSLGSKIADNIQTSFVLLPNAVVIALAIFRIFGEEADMDPYELDWGIATIESYSDESKTANHVFNHDLSRPETLDRTVRFIRGRLVWFQLQLPKGANQVVYLDDRGQQVSDKDRDFIRDSLAPLTSGVNFLSEVY